MSQKKTTYIANVNFKRNENMNKSAILFDKLDQRIANQLPKYVAAYEKEQNLTKSQTERKNRTLLKLLENSTQAMNRNMQEEESDDVSMMGLQENKKKFPTEIVNILYRQNVSGYNPYLSTLKKLDQIPNLSHNICERIKKLCYIGIAKSHLRSGGSTNLTKYSRVGILIRRYMNLVMSSKMEQVKNFQPQTVLIKINSTALSFNPNKRPQELEESISKKKYGQIIEGVNRIIESEYKKYKMGSTNNLNYSLTYSEMVMYTGVILIIIAMVLWTPQPSSLGMYAFLVAIFSLICIGSGMAWRQCNKNIQSVVSSSNTTDQIMLRLKHYLQSVSNDTLIWKIGPDFYWLEAHNIKVKKRKYQQNTDDF